MDSRTVVHPSSFFFCPRIPHIIYHLIEGTRRFSNPFQRHQRKPKTAVLVSDQQVEAGARQSPTLASLSLFLPNSQQHLNNTTTIASSRNVSFCHFLCRRATPQVSHHTGLDQTKQLFLSTWWQVGKIRKNPDGFFQFFLSFGFFVLFPSFGLIVITNIVLMKTIIMINIIELLFPLG